jgi:hypothetical protein
MEAGRPCDATGRGDLEFANRQEVRTERLGEGPGPFSAVIEAPEQTPSEAQSSAIQRDCLAKQPTKQVRVDIGPGDFQPVLWSIFDSRPEHRRRPNEVLHLHFECDKVRQSEETIGQGAKIHW